MSHERVLVVEDESAIAELIAINLRHAGHEVTLAAERRAGAACHRRVLPDLVLLDWMLPGQSGWRWPGAGAPTRARASCRSSCSPRAPRRPTRSPGLDAGADDYLTKPFSTKELLARIRAVLRRKAPEHAGRGGGSGGLRLDPATRRVSARGRQSRAQAGPDRVPLLHFLMTHPERVHSRAQLLDRVWGDHVFIEERTVDVHVKRLREALAPAQLRHLIETVRGAGYRLTQQVAAQAEASGAAR
jgi:two-component system phosphate regulon response regulator PhoB